VLGLVLAFVGSALLIWDEMRTAAAGIKSYTGKLRGNFLKQVAFSVARWFGSSDPRDQQSYLAESFPKRFWGFLFLLLGFLAQALGAIIGPGTASR
jgi:hypothetical protein